MLAETLAERDRLARELDEARTAFASPAATIDTERTTLRPYFNLTLRTPIQSFELAYDRDEERASLQAI